MRKAPMPKHANEIPHAEEVRRASIYMLKEQIKYLTFKG
jgi:hypothetical protein